MRLFLIILFAFYSGVFSVCYWVFSAPQLLPFVAVLSSMAFALICIELYHSIKNTYREERHVSGTDN